jgi:hypothetical protein
MKEFSKQWLDNWRRDCRLLRRWQRPCQQDRGAALLEFALTLPLLLIITIFLVEMALYWEGRILGNHASFALARIAKVHYQPDENLENQTYFPEKCLLHSQYLQTMNGLQSGLSTERLVTAFFMFPVTRQAINDKEAAIFSGSDTYTNISSMADGMRKGIIKQFKECLKEYLNESVVPEISSDVKSLIITNNFAVSVGSLIPEFGGFWGKIVKKVLATMISELIEETIEKVLDNILKKFFSYAIEQSIDFIDQHLDSAETFLANFIDPNNSSGIIAAGFFISCYSRYDLACQRVDSDANNGTKLKIGSEQLIPEGEGDNKVDTSFLAQLTAWFMSINSDKSSDEEDDQYKAWEKEIEDYKNTTPGRLIFPRHASDAEASAAIVTVELTYPVKSHWFSLTAAMAEDDSLTKIGQVTFTSKHAMLAELPKQNINEYHAVYETIGQKAGDAISELLDKISVLIDYIDSQIKGAKEKTFALDELDTWKSKATARMERQDKIIDELTTVEEHFKNISVSEIQATTKNYAHSIAGAKKAIDDLKKAKNAICDEETGLIEKYTVIRETCYTYSLNDAGVPEKTKTADWDTNDAIITALENFVSDASTSIINLENYIDGETKTTPYDSLCDEESAAWLALIEYYNQTLKTGIETQRFGEEGKTPEATDDTTRDTLVGEIGLSDEKDKLKMRKNMQSGLDDSRELIRDKIFAVIKNLEDFDLFNSSDPFDDSGGPKGLLNADGTYKILEAYEMLNEYYETDNEAPVNFVD